jgi:serine O-acetyltransferase
MGEAMNKIDLDGSGSHNDNPHGISLVSLVLEDFRTHDSDVFEPGFWALAVHRFGNWRMDVAGPARAPLTLAYRAFHRAIVFGFGIDLGYTVKVGRRVRIWHHGGIVLGARSIGDDVHIRHNTTFGVASRHERDAKPIIGDRVDVGAGACVLGDVTVGHDAVIGANSVVVRDVAAGSVVLGVPARPVQLKDEKVAPSPAVAREAAAVTVSSP